MNDFLVAKEEEDQKFQDESGEASGGHQPQVAKGLLVIVERNLFEVLVEKALGLVPQANSDQQGRDLGKQSSDVKDGRVDGVEPDELSPWILHHHDIILADKAGRDKNR